MGYEWLLCWVADCLFIRVLGFGLIVVLLGFNAWVCFSTCGFCWLKFVFDSRCVVVVAFAGCGWFSLLLSFWVCWL